MAAGPLKGGSSSWAASAHPALAVQVGQAQPVLCSIRVSLPCDAAVISGLQVFAYNIYLGVAFCAMLFVIRARFYGGVFFCGDGVSSGTAPFQSFSGWVASQFSFREVPFAVSLM